MYKVANSYQCAEASRTFRSILNSNLQGNVNQNGSIMLQFTHLTAGCVHNSTPHTPDIPALAA